MSSNSDAFIASLLTVSLVKFSAWTNAIFSTKTELKIAHVAIRAFEIRNIAMRIDLTDEMICPGPLLPIGDSTDIW